MKTLGTSEVSASSADCEGWSFEKVAFDDSSVSDGSGEVVRWGQNRLNADSGNDGVVKESLRDDDGWRALNWRIDFCCLRSDQDTPCLRKTSEEDIEMSKVSNKSQRRK